MANLPYATSGWRKHTEVKLREIDFPIPALPSHFTVLRTYQGPRETFEPMALDTIDREFDGSLPSRPRAYFVQQGKLDDADAGQVRYTRMFSTIPATWIEYMSDPFIFPALAGSVVGAGVSVTAIAQTPTSTTSDIYCDTTGFSSGDSIYVSIYYSYSLGGGVTAITTLAGFLTILNVVSSAVLTTKRVFSSNSPYYWVSGTVRSGEIGRYIAKHILVPQKLTYDYFLTGDSSAIGLPSIFDPIQITQATDGSGNPIGPEAGASVTALSASTSPTADEYRALIVAETDLVVSCSIDRYLGNIWRRTTRTVTAR